MCVLTLPDLARAVLCALPAAGGIDGLAERFGVARGRMADLLADLADNGFVVRREGTGDFILTEAGAEVVS